MTHPDGERMVRAHERYRARFNAVHGEGAGERRGVSKGEDYALFGDLVDVETLNKTNVEASTAYVKTYERELGKLVDDMGDELLDPVQLISALFPVMLGMFEQCFLLGYLYRDEEEKDKRAKLILP